MVGLAIGISVAMDAITDPLIGAWSDRIRTRWGRRHPMLLAAALPLAISFVLLFNPPRGMSDFEGFLWLATFGVLVRASFTFYNIPHLALGAEMAHDYYQRSTLFAYSAFIGAMSVAVSYGLITGYYFPTVEGVYDPGFLNPDGYPAMSVTFAIVMVAAILLCVAGTRKEIPHLRETQERAQIRFLSLFMEIWEVLKNASFRAVFFGLLLGSMVGWGRGGVHPLHGHPLLGTAHRRPLLPELRRHLLLPRGVRAHSRSHAAARQAHGRHAAPHVLDHRDQHTDLPAAVRHPVVSGKRDCLGAGHLPRGVDGGRPGGSDHRRKRQLDAGRRRRRARTRHRDPPRGCPLLRACFLGQGHVRIRHGVRRRPAQRHRVSGVRDPGGGPRPRLCGASASSRVPPRRSSRCWRSCSTCVTGSTTGATWRSWPA